MERKKSHICPRCGIKVINDRPAAEIITNLTVNVSKIKVCKNCGCIIHVDSDDSSRIRYT
jgi:hypothetical protein